MDIEELVKLTSRAWSLPILAELHRGVPGRQAALITATGAGRSSFGPSLAHLIDLGFVQRTPGHGHPFRAEFQLTPRGEAVAALAERLDVTAQQTFEKQLLRRSWTLPVISLSGAPVGFSQIKAGLPGITDRALSQSLQKLVTVDWMRQDTDRCGPMRRRYVVQNAGSEVYQTLAHSRES